MTSSFPQVRALAKRLLEQENAGGAANGTALVAAERVVRRLGERISPLVGLAGFHLLFQRALSRAERVHGWLEKVRVERDSTFALLGAAEAAAAESPHEIAAAAESIVAELIGLMARFLGAEMTIRLVRQSFSAIGEHDQRPTSEDNRG